MAFAYATWLSTQNKLSSIPKILRGLWDNKKETGLSHHLWNAMCQTHLGRVDSKLAALISI